MSFLKTISCPPMIFFPPSHVLVYVCVPRVRVSKRVYALIFGSAGLKRLG